MSYSPSGTNPVALALRSCGVSDSKSALRSDAEVQQKPAGYGDPAETPEVEPNDPPEFKREAPPLDLDDVGPALDVNEGKEHPAPSSTSGSDSH